MKSRRLLALFFSFVLAMGLGSAFAYADEGGASADIAVATLAPQEAEDSASVSWEAADFTYGDYEKTLYGCDYSREFTVSGKVVTGFSEAGAAKLAECKDLVIPAKDADGNTIIGIGTSAFSEKGLTSVTFPDVRLVDYDDEATHGHITKRGNFIIAESAFAKNSLTEVTLPNGVLAVMPNAFQYNQITRVNLPSTIWWIETLSFANNAIEYVNFPQTCDFQLEMHGMAFADNNIKAVRLPDFTEVVNKHVFDWNPGMEPLDDAAPANLKTHGTGANAKECGVVYLYADVDLSYKGRIHTVDRQTESTKSWTQRLIINNSPESEAFTPFDETDLAQWGWTAADFMYDGSIVTGLSESGLAKRADGAHRDLVIPERTSAGVNVTEIAAGPAQAGGLFGTAAEGFDSVYIPSQCTKIGANAFRAFGTVNDETHVVENGLKRVTLPQDLVEIGASAFMMNSLTSVDLPNKVTTVGGGAFATNPGLTHIGLSSAMTEIAPAAFGCSDGKNYMSGLEELTIPEGITKIGNNAFAGNNIHDIVIPEGVTEIGDYAFSTKNYLCDPCTLTLPEGLTKIGKMAFRNKVISSVVLPTTVTALPDGNTKDNDVFTKEYSPGSENTIVNTIVLVSNKAQYDDKENFANSKYRTIYYTESADWTAADFTYGEWSSANLSLHPVTDTSDELATTVNAVTGFSEMGLVKLQNNTDLVIPATDTDGNQVCAVANSAFQKKGLTSVTFPENVKVANDKTSWNADVAERGNFFIGASAFLGNALTDLTIPEGVIYVGVNAFQGNSGLAHVKLPSTLMLVGYGAFAKGSIASVEFPEATDFPLQLSIQAFAINKIKSVQIPTDTSFMNKWVFLQNTGVEEITEGTAAEKKGGLVYVYVTDKSKLGSKVDYKTAGTSNVQEIVEGDIPSADAPWGVSDFAFDEAGTTVTGLSANGKAKLKVNPNMVIPDQKDGKDIIGIGAGVLGSGATSDTYEGAIGTFGYKESGVAYVPTAVKLPARLQSIGNNAFSAYPSNSDGKHVGITSISFPSTLTSIGNTAFQNAPLTEVVIPDSVTTIGQAAFTTTENSAVKITSAKLSKNAPIAASMFVQQGIKDIVIPEGVTSIGQKAFQGNFSKTVSLPSTLTAIPNYAFDNNQFTSAEIPASVTSIGNYAFRLNKEGKSNTLASVTLHEGLTSIGNQSFAGSALTSVDLPTTVTTVNKDAFKSSVNNVKLLSTVADQANATGDYTKVVTAGSGHEVVYNPQIGGGWYRYDFRYSDDETTILGFSDTGKARALTNRDLVLPARASGEEPAVADANSAGGIGIQSIMGLFAQADEPEVPAGTITTIAEGAFVGDETSVGKTGYNTEDGLTSVKLPSSLTTIGKNAFAYNALSEVDFSACSGIESIGETAFKGNNLGKVELPDTVTSLGDGAFATNNITTLKLSSGVTTIPQGAFSMNIRLRSVEIPNTVTEIGDTAFAGARLETLEIPASVTKIGRKAFHLHHLTELTVPGTVKEVGESAFEGTFKEQTLVKLTLGEGIETIGKHAFKEGLLTEVKLPNSLQALGEDAFLNNVGEQKSGVVKAMTDNAEHLAINKTADTVKVVCTDNTAAANTVGAMITSLPEQPSAEEIAQTQAVYDALTDEQKELVGDVVDALNQAERAKASEVEDKISEIGIVELTDACKNAIDAAKKSFDELSSKMQAMVSSESVATLEDAQRKYADLEAAAQAEKAIGAIGESVTLDGKDAVEAARKAYDALSDEQKALVDPAKLEALESAEVKVSNLEAAAQAEKAIGAIGESVTLGSKDAVEAARKAYDALSDEQKALVDPAKLEALGQAEAAYNELVANDATSVIKGKIGNISSIENLSDVDSDAVAGASEVYDALTDEQKDGVSKDVKDKLAVAKALAGVKAINDEVSDVDAAQAAIDAYDALTDDQKGFVSEAVQAAVSEKKGAVNKAAAARAVAAIDAIGSKVTTGSKDAVEAARKAYDALSDEQKALVDPAKLEALESAEAVYAKAVADQKAAAEKAAAAKAAAAKAAAEKAAASNVNTATVTAAQAKKASSLGVTTITLGAKVKKIAKGAFKGTKITTIIVKSKKLKKKSVKGSLKGSKVKTVKVQIGKKKANKKFVKKYKKIFTKKNAGKKVKVK